MIGNHDTIYASLYSQDSILPLEQDQDSQGPSICADVLLRIGCLAACR